MGNKLCSCTKGVPDDDNDSRPRGKGTNDSEPTRIPPAASNTSIPVVIRSPNEILDDSLKQEINNLIRQETNSISINYKNERDRIVEQMKNAAPDRYLGLAYDDYPEVNGRTVNEMAEKVVTSSEVKQQIFDRVQHDIEPSMQSRTAEWEEPDCEKARDIVTTYIEQQIQETFANIQLN